MSLGRHPLSLRHLGCACLCKYGGGCADPGASAALQQRQLTCTASARGCLVAGPELGKALMTSPGHARGRPVGGALALCPPARDGSRTTSPFEKRPNGHPSREFRHEMLGAWSCASCAVWSMLTVLGSACKGSGSNANLLPLAGLTQGNATCMEPALQVRRRHARLILVRRCFALLVRGAVWPVACFERPLLGCSPCPAVSTEMALVTQSLARRTPVIAGHDHDRCAQLVRSCPSSAVSAQFATLAAAPRLGDHELAEACVKPCLQQATIPLAKSPYRHWLCVRGALRVCRGFASECLERE